MALPDGTVTFEVGGETKRLRFTINALCALEEKTGSNVLQIAGELSYGVSMATLRAMFWAGMVGGNLTLEQAGDLIDNIGVARARVIAGEAFAATFPVADEDDNKNPPKAAG